MIGVLPPAPVELPKKIDQTWTYVALGVGLLVVLGAAGFFLLGGKKNVVRKES